MHTAPKSHVGAFFVITHSALEKSQESPALLQIQGRGQTPVPTPAYNKYFEEGDTHQGRKPTLGRCKRNQCQSGHQRVRRLVGPGVVDVVDAGVVDVDVMGAGVVVVSVVDMESVGADVVVDVDVMGAGVVVVSVVDAESVGADVVVDVEVVGAGIGTPVVCMSGQVATPGVSTISCGVAPQHPTMPFLDESREVQETCRALKPLPLKALMFSARSPKKCTRCCWITMSCLAYQSTMSRTPNCLVRSGMYTTKGETTFSG